VSDKRDEREWEIIEFDAEAFEEPLTLADDLKEITFRRKSMRHIHAAALAASSAMQLGIEALHGHIEGLDATSPFDPEDVVRRLRDDVSAHLAGLDAARPRQALESAEDVLGNMLMLVRMTLDRMEDDDDAG
jgi:hypothetical protein